MQARPWPWTPTRALRLSAVFSRSRLRFAGGCCAAFAFGYGAPMLYAYSVGRLFALYAFREDDMRMILIICGLCGGSGWWIVQAGKVALASVGMMMLGRLSLEHPGTCREERIYIIVKA